MYLFGFMAAPGLVDHYSQRGQKFGTLDSAGVIPGILS